MNSRKITLYLSKPEHENYLRMIFNTPKGPIKVCRANPVGKMLFSRVSYAERPEQSTGPFSYSTPVELLLPETKHDLSDHRFIRYNQDDHIRINDYLESTLYLEMANMIHVAVNDLGMERKQAIEIITHHFYGGDHYEKVKKREYRKRQKVKSWIIDSCKTLGIKI